jgi:hypothetical protein
MLQKHFHTQEDAMDRWPFWMLEENIKLVNEILEEEDKHRKQEEGDQKANMPDTNSMMRNASSFTNNIPKF